LANVSMLRLDQLGGEAPGNKSFKLKGYVAEAERLGIGRLVSFGGAWSNHLHALAATGVQYGLETVGIVRGESTEAPTAMLADAKRWGMNIVHLSRSEYRLRNEPDYLSELNERFSPCLVIPEGGAAFLGAQHCREIAELLEQADAARKVVLPVGTGTTLAGLVAALDGESQVIGISALKGALDLEMRVQSLLEELSPKNSASWTINHDYHCGGFARTNAQLREFVLQFEACQNILLDPVYTAKMLYGIAQLQAGGDWDATSPVLAIHTGGLQGRRGYGWLDKP
jgi:1-aminocyclopropane-1-carboxylate deaminase